MDLASLLASGEELLFTAELEESLDRFLDAALAPELDIGVVSARYPLLANLNVIENVALQAMFHANKSLAWVRNKLSPHIEQLALEETLAKRKAELSEEETLNVLLLRCLAVPCRAVLLDKPEPWNYASARNFLKSIDSGPSLWMCCYRAEASQYAHLGLRRIAVDATG
jgi:ABC-type uncharacterized transport system ATPase subunit